MILHHLVLVSVAYPTVVLWVGEAMRAAVRQSRPMVDDILKRQTATLQSALLNLAKVNSTESPNAANKKATIAQSRSLFRRVQQSILTKNPWRGEAANPKSEFLNPKKLRSERCAQNAELLKRKNQTKRA